MTSGQDVSEFLNTLGLVKSYFSSFLRKKEKNRDFFLCGAPTPQRIRRVACLQDCLLTLTCHLVITRIRWGGGGVTLLFRRSGN
jgi:hypothetical protein